MVSGGTGALVERRWNCGRGDRRVVPQDADLAAVHQEVGGGLDHVAPGGGDLGVRTAKAEPAPALPPAPIPYSQLARAAPEPSPSYAAPVAPPTQSASAYLPPPGAYRVQVGAFGDRLRAERALDLLAHSGEAVIEPVETGGGTLYRVMLNVPGDEGRAWALRDQVASVGFADARVIHPY